MTSPVQRAAQLKRRLAQDPRVRRLVDRARREGSAVSSLVADPFRRTPPASSTGRAEVIDGATLSGWVAVDPSNTQNEVDVYLNEIHVVTLPLVADAEDESRRTFRFRIRPLLRFARRTDRLTVRYAGTALPFTPGDSVIHRPTEQGKRPTSVLRRRLAHGDIFNSEGHLQKPKNADPKWQSGVLGLYATVRTVLHDECGIDAFLIYGSLLGAVRDGGFIGHDTDLDAGYISARTDPAEVARELTEIAAVLIAHGLHVESRVVCLHIYDPSAEGVHIDLFHTFFGADDVLLFPWGVAGTSGYHRSQWHGAHEIDFVGSRVLVPSEPEALVETMYGAGWRVPDPGFSWKDDRTAVDLTGRVGPKLNSDTNWLDHYARRALDTESNFVRTCLAVRDLPSTVVDLGSGDGRDSAAFARQGRTVIGVDVAATAIASARTRPEAESATFAVLDVEDIGALRAVIDDARDGDKAVLFYAHHLLDALFEPTATALLDLICEVARPGDAVAFASATSAPGKYPLCHRRAVDPAELASLLTAANFRTVHDATTEDAEYGPVNELIARRAEPEEN